MNLNGWEMDICWILWRELSCWSVQKSRNVPNDLLPTPLPGVRERNWSVERQWNIKNLKNDRTLEFKEIFQDNLPYYLILQRSRHFKWPPKPRLFSTRNRIITLVFSLPNPLFLTSTIFELAKYGSFFLLLTLKL